VRGGYCSGKAGEKILTMEGQLKVGLWATARAEDSQQTGGHRGVADTLTSQARIGVWPTPTKSDSNGACNRTDKPNKDGLRLTSVAKAAMWPTPQVCQAPNMSKNRGKDWGGERERITPQSIKGLWPTATSRDWRSGKASDETMAKNARPLSEVLERAFGPTAPGSNVETVNSGAPNPEFVAWLMGLPWDYLKLRETQSSGQLPLL
jgi:hypothetical protein